MNKAFIVYNGSAIMNRLSEFPETLIHEGNTNFAIFAGDRDGTA